MKTNYEAPYLDIFRIASENAFLNPISGQDEMDSAGIMDGGEGIEVF